MSRRQRLNAKKRNRKIVIFSIIAAVIALGAVLVLIVVSGTSSPLSGSIGQPVPASLYQTIAGVPDSTLTAIGSPTSVTPPSAISGAPLKSNQKPLVFYVGGEYCPYCAVERWSMIVALSKFGTFSGLQYMLSSATDVNANTPTFTFANATYTSQYITFLPVEEWDRSDNVRQPLTTNQSALFNQYGTCASSGTSGGIPFVDIANSYVVNCGAQNTLDLSGDSWTQVAGVLNSSSNSIAIGVDGAANTLITAICKVDGAQPSSVCGQPFADVPLAYAVVQSPVQTSVETFPAGYGKPRTE